MGKRRLKSGIHIRENDHMNLDENLKMISLDDFILNYEIYAEHGKVKKYSDVSYKDKTYPLVSVHYGNPKAPTLLLTGGIHGLERIGAQLTLSLLNSFHTRLSWDKTLKDMLNHVHVVFLPLANPVGFFNTTRSNGNAVDLMRNAEIESSEKVPSLLGGHRKYKWLPWHRGFEVQKETQFIIDTVKDILLESNTLISLDSHSGFGIRDQLWFPFAYSKKAFTQILELFLLFKLFRKSFPSHVYKIEPQSKNYMTHGDIWDYCFENIRKPNQIFLPITLEMGSWIWVKKNPLQIFSKSGLFNPIKSHRIHRTLRRHRPLFDFLLHALISNEHWTEINSEIRNFTEQQALKKYYE